MFEVSHISTYLQVNKYIKQSNSFLPTDTRIVFTTKALNFTFDLCKSMRKLVKVFEMKHQKTVFGTEREVEKLLSCFKQKLGAPFLAVKAAAVWNKNFWYELQINASTAGPSSDRTEEAWKEVYSWVQKNPKFFTDSDDSEDLGEGDNDEEEELPSDIEEDD
jgi:hypothetical protein